MASPNLKSDLSIRKSLTTTAYEQLEELIVTAELEPGAILSEATLVEQLGIGRTPIREALQKLEREGLIRIMPRLRSVLSFFKGATLSENWSRFLAAKSLLLLGAATIILAPTLSAFDLNHISATVPVTLSALLALSIVRPSVALIVATTIFPITGWITQAFSLGPMRLSEALVLVVLGGVIIRLALSPKELKAGSQASAIGIVSASFLFIAVTATSIVVELSLLRTGSTASWLNVWTFLTETLNQITSDYLLGNSVVSLPGLIDGALLIEGLLLVLVILKYSESNPALPRHLAGALVTGAFISAVINLNLLATNVIEADESMTMLARYLGGLRLSGHIQDLNATGSYFLTMMFVGIGFIAGRKNSRLLGCVIFTIGVAFWLAGSRSALFAGLVVVLLATGQWVLSKRRGQSRTALIALVIVVSLLTPLLMVVAYPERSRISAGLQHRIDFTITSIRM